MQLVLHGNASLFPTLVSERAPEPTRPVALRSAVHRGSRQGVQFGYDGAGMARRPARCGKPDLFAPKENPATAGCVRTGASQVEKAASTTMRLFP
jgi:hypothetical protein